MASTKDRYEAGRWLSGRFAAGKWRGTGVDVELVVRRQVIIIGTSRKPITLRGTSSEPITLTGAPR